MEAGHFLHILHRQIQPGLVTGNAFVLCTVVHKSAANVFHSADKRNIHNKNDNFRYALNGTLGRSKRAVKVFV